MSAPVLPVWSVPALRAVVDAADRPCTVSPAMVALSEAVTEDEGQGVDVVEARGVCGACPVRVACLALAMAPVTEVVDGVPETVPYAPVGVWGGLTGPERAELAGYLVADPNTVPVVPVGAVGPFVGPDWCAVCGLRLSSRHPGHRYCSVQCKQTARAAARRAARQGVAA
ncbi:WhiB family transcriptional regulator [Candidatus Frankia alpina]|nr:WhiB family transcriptional regulator [Candidatus Frankia alpina]